MEYGVIGLYYIVPVLNQRLVHLVNVLEGTVTISDDVGMVEMRIGREERVLGVEFVVHVIVLLFLGKVGVRLLLVQIFANLAEIWRGIDGRYTFAKKTVMM